MIEFLEFGPRAGDALRAQLPEENDGTIPDRSVVIEMQYPVVYFETQFNFVKVL